MKRIIKISIASILAAILLVGAAFGIFVAAKYVEVKSFDVSGTPFTGKYSLDESGAFVADIPREKYIVSGYEYKESNETIFDIRAYGASSAESYEVNGRAVNAAIEAAKECGGIVVVSGGSYLACDIVMRSGVTLRIEEGSELKNVAYGDRSGGSAHNAFIYAEDCEDIVIEGPGRINGQGASYCDDAEDSSLFYPLDTFNLKAYIIEHRKRIMSGKTKEVARPYLICFKNCRGAAIRNIELYEASSWTVRAEDNENLCFDRVIINNNIRVANSDGIDIVGGRNICVTRAFIATGDDGICLKTENESGAIEGVTVEDCEIFSLANCFKIGTDTYKDVKNVKVSNCEFFVPGIAGGYAGIAIEAVDGGKVSEIEVRDIRMDHVTAPLLIWLGYRHGDSQIENVSIKNIVAAGCDLPSAIVGYSKSGKESKVKGVSISGFEVSYREAKAKLDIYHKDEVYSGDMNMKGYPEITRVSHRYFINHTLSGYYDLPVSGLYVAHAEGLEIKGLSIAPRKSDPRPISNI